MHKINRSMISVSAIALGAIVLSGCAGTSDSSSSADQEATSGEVASTPTEVVEEESVEVDEQVEGDGSSGLDEESNGEPEELVGDETEASEVVDPTACADISFAFDTDWEDKGLSYQQLWLMPNVSVTNNCDKRIKSIKFSFRMTDDFGEAWPGSGYNYQDRISLKVGETSQPNANGYSHYDFAENFTFLTDMDPDDQSALIETVTLAFADGTTAESSTERIVTP